MAFNELALAAFTTAAGNTVWTYRTADTIAQLQAAGYFASAIRIRAGDVIHAQAADGMLTLRTDASRNAIIEAAGGTAAGATIAKTADFTLTAAEAGSQFEVTSTTTVTCTLPNNLAAGLIWVVRQGGIGEVLFSPASGATLQAPGGATRTSEQYAEARLRVVSNSNGTSAVYSLTGRIY